jgi:competence protein ComGC
MVFNSKDKKGQAAIEFLMTYGWMLLVVLIVGALIFSFVDFGALLPNNLDLNNGFRQLSPDKITAYESSSTVSFATTYISASLGQIPDLNSATLNVDGDVYACRIMNVTNSDTGQSAGLATPVNFVNGQIGVFQFNCSYATPTFPRLVAGDIIEGNIVIKYRDPKVQALTLTSSGTLRVSIEE